MAASVTLRCCIGVRRERQVRAGDAMLPSHGGGPSPLHRRKTGPNPKNRRLLYG